MIAGNMQSRIQVQKGINVQQSVSYSIKGNTGRLKMFSVITNIYNKKPKYVP
jgi:hypothetical protein